MLEELKLAIQMWQEIVDKCKSGEPFNVVKFKKSFCENYHLDWYNNCYFCQHCECFTSCPLNNCSSLYEKVRDKHDITSAELILNAIRGYTND